MYEIIYIQNKKNNNNYKYSNTNHNTYYIHVYYKITKQIYDYFYKTIIYMHIMTNIFAKQYVRVMSLILTMINILFYVNNFKLNKIPNFQLQRT